MPEWKVNGPSYSLPTFEDWQAKPEWRLQLEADAYVDTFAVGRDVFLTGRVSWRTIAGRPDADGWQYNGDHLYRVTDEGSNLYASDLEPTDKMRATVRDELATLLVEPSDELRIATVRDVIERRTTNAKDEHDRTDRDTLELAERFASALIVDLPELYMTNETEPAI